jgi:sortase B
MIPLLVIFILSATHIYQYYHERAEANAKTEDLRRLALEDNPDASDDKSGVKAPISVDFDALQAENEDVIAWIYCEDTPINYPIVKSADNSDYLHALLDGSYNAEGTLFVDYRNASDFSDFYTIVYGHNMKNADMFGTLVNYREQEYYDEHPVMWLLTPDGDYRVDLFSGYVIPSDSSVYSVITAKEEKESFLRTAYTSSLFDSTVTCSTSERFLLLSTCSYEYDGARFVVVGKLVS